MKSKIKNAIKFFYYKFFEIINHIYIFYFKKKYKKKILENNSLTDHLDGETILILAPHIDDDIIGCGGAIIKYLSQGKNVYVAYLTNSGKQGKELEKSKIIQERRVEAINVANKLNISTDHLFFLGGEDGDLINSKINDSLLNILNSVNIDTIFMPCFLDSHSDHFAVTEIIKNIYFSNPKILSNLHLYLYESQSPFTPFYANIFLDITNIFSLKKILLNCYVSQPPDFKFAYNLNKINGIAFDNNILCETYIKTNFQDYINFYIKYCGSFENYLTIKNQIIPHGYSDSLINSINSSIRTKKILKSL